MDCRVRLSGWSVGSFIRNFGFVVSWVLGFGFIRFCRVVLEIVSFRVVELNIVWMLFVVFISGLVFFWWSNDIGWGYGS